MGRVPEEVGDSDEAEVGDEETAPGADSSHSRRAQMAATAREPE